MNVDGLTLIYRNGEAGSARAALPDKGQKAKQIVANQAQVTKADPEADLSTEAQRAKVERSWWEILLFGGKTAGLTGCGRDAVQIDEPYENSILLKLEGEGRFFLENPEIELVAKASDDKPIRFEDLQNKMVRVELGTDSSLIDVDGDNAPDMPKEGCYPGLIDATPATPEDKEQGFYCQEKDESGAEIYEDFAVCPSNPGKRQKIYLAGYTLEIYKYAKLENKELIYEKVDEKTETLTTVEELFLDPESGLEIPVICGDAPMPIEIPVNPDWYSDGNLYLKIRLNVIVDARQADGNAYYKTHLMVKIKSQ
ncbi:MAG: hypothetical protein V3T21_05995 [Candidatus Margulisiibacteriota bacterium]